MQYLAEKQFKGRYSLYVMLLSYQAKVAPLFNKLAENVTDQELEELMRCAPKQVAAFRAIQNNNTMQLSGITNNLFFQGVKSVLSQLLSRIDSLEKPVLEHKQALMEHLDPDTGAGMGFSNHVGTRRRYQAYSN